jgi:translation initiation factor IF-2
MKDIFLKKPAVITVMGHVDHGKTTLLDAIRNTNVAEKEVGQITQHIGASKIKLNGDELVFIDTPGHEAFTALRARGAKITDIVVLVVAADDGVMPQTIEALNHAKAAKVPIIVVINKIDLPTANPYKIKEKLAEYELVPEEWGGKTTYVEVSALKRQNLSELLDILLLQAELLELKAKVNGKAKGVILEARLDSRKGPLATVITQEGKLRIGDVFVAGTTYGKVRSMTNDRGKRLEEVLPGTPVEVLGFEELPQAGDKFSVMDDIKQAKEFVLKEKEAVRIKQERPARVFSLEDLYKISKDKPKELPLIIKADVWGSVEAVSHVLNKFNQDKVKINILHKAVGGIKESDLLLACASSAIIVGFGVYPDMNIQSQAKKLGVEIRTYQIIYDLIDDIKKALEGLLEPQEEEIVIGELEIRKIFRIPKVGLIAGCYVKEGKVEKGALCKVLRDSKVIHEDRIISLKRFKENVVSVSSGYECGVGIGNAKDLLKGDNIIVYKKRLISPKLS